MCSNVITFGHFLLLICLVSIWSLDQLKETRRVKEIFFLPHKGMSISHHRALGQRLVGRVKKGAPKRGMLQKEDNVLSFREITERRENIGVDRTGLVWSHE